MRRNLNHSKITGLLLTALLFALVLAPIPAFAETPAGTVISNTATVTWTGGSDTATATVTVSFKEATPTLTLATVSPATSVSEGTAMTLTYALTSQANGFDTYDLSTNIPSVPELSDVTPVLSAATLSLGGTSAISTSVAAGSTTITIPSPSAFHGLIAESAPGLADGSLVVINGYNATTYAVTAIDDTGPYSITIAGTPVINPGDLIVEQKNFTVTFTTGTLQASFTSGIYAVTTTAQDDAAAQAAASVSQDITVTKAVVTFSKVANPTTAQPGTTVTYTMTVTNAGPGTATNVVITDPIQNFTTYVDATASAPGGSIEYFESGSWNVGVTDPALVTSIRATFASVAVTSVTLSFDVTID